MICPCKGKFVSLPYDLSLEREKAVSLLYDLLLEGKFVLLLYDLFLEKENLFRCCMI